MPYITDLEKDAMEKGEQVGEERGFINGQITDKQEVLLKFMNKKFKLTNKEQEIISKEFNPDILDKALDEILFADTKDAVLKFFK